MSNSDSELLTPDKFAQIIEEKIPTFDEKWNKLLRSQKQERYDKVREIKNEIQDLLHSQQFDRGHFVYDIMFSVDNMFGRETTCSETSNLRKKLHAKYEEYKKNDGTNDVLKQECMEYIQQIKNREQHEQTLQEVWWRYLETLRNRYK